MMMPTKIVSSKKYDLNYCNTCMLAAEADGVLFIENPASCGCPDTRYRDCLDCKSCYIKNLAKVRTGAVCNKGCGVDLGIGQHLLGTTKEWRILKMYTCKACGPERKEVGNMYAVEGCDKYQQNGCSGHCRAHATQEQRDSGNARYRKKQRGVLLRVAISIHGMVAVDIAWNM
jgi:hypothetical protein